jgi:UTP--glucose-1-phosphate uridylyltransferase
MKVRKAVIPAAGLGTRFLPATKAMPKEMLPIVDKPIIQYVVEEAVAAGIEDILIITGRGKRAIEDHFDRSIELELYLRSGAQVEVLEAVRSISDMVNVHFIRQKEALGLGHAVLQAQQHVGDEPFAVLLGDEIFAGARPCLGELMDQYQAMSGGSLVAVRPVPQEQVSRYGVIRAKTVRPGFYHVQDMVEKPMVAEAPSNLAVVGRYIIEPAVFEVLRDTAPGRNGEIQLTDALNVLAHESQVYAYETNSQRYDVGNKLGYIQATLEFALRRPDLEKDLREYLEQLTSHPAVI